MSCKWQNNNPRVAPTAAFPWSSAVLGPRSLPCPGASTTHGNPTQQVMGNGRQEGDTNDLGDAPHLEALHPVFLPGLGIDALRCGEPMLVDGLTFRGFHPLPPGQYLWGGSGLPTHLLVILPLFGWGINPDTTPLQGGNVLEVHEPSVRQIGLRMAARALGYLVLHRQRLSLISAPVDHLYSHDDLAAHICGHLDVVGWPKAAVRHLHHSGLGVGGGHPGLRHLGGTLLSRLAPLTLFNHLDLGQLGQGLFYPLQALPGRPFPSGSLSVGDPWVRVLSLFSQAFHLGLSGLQTFFQTGLPAKGLPASTGPDPQAVLS